MLASFLVCFLVGVTAFTKSAPLKLTTKNTENQKKMKQQQDSVCPQTNRFRYINTHVFNRISMLSVLVCTQHCIIVVVMRLRAKMLKAGSHGVGPYGIDVDSPFKRKTEGYVWDLFSKECVFTRCGRSAKTMQNVRFHSRSYSHWWDLSISSRTPR